MARKRFEDPEVRKRQILDAAQKLLARKTFRELSMEDIAHAAGISKGLLYLYFKDKDALFAQAVLDMAGAFRALLTGLPGASDPRRELEALIRAMLAFGESRREMTSQFIGEQLMSSPHARQLAREWNEVLNQIARRLKTCVDAGLLRTHDLDLAAEVLIEVLKLYLTRKYIHKKIAGDLTEKAPEIADFFIHGFGQPTSGERKGRA